MAELVVPGPAQRVTVLAVVVGGAHHPVLVLEPRVELLVDAVGPVVAGVQLVLGGQSADQGLVCKRNVEICFY